ncbi:MAG TPA: hypothetical protein DD381_12970 [Lentisphaeria bacterium]|nr:MAG: hypothetical protein A2X47_12530 [Lentisphaerae bacterium GWF2_38_69]HBM17234.1 hypothetical protein [Lentisphaeria bacterium]
MKTKPLIGISSCLLGENVRYDGGHKLDHHLKNILGEYVVFLGICPELECGMSIPREPMRLEFSNNKVRLITLSTRRDLTHQINSWIEEKLKELYSKHFCGFIFKSKSPSCALRKFPVFGADGSVEKTSSGLFAKALMKKYPSLPVEDESKLLEDSAKERFLKKVFDFEKKMRTEKIQCIFSSSLQKQ